VKLLAILSTAALTCLLVIGRAAIAQGPGYKCYGYVHVCPTLTCVSSTGECPNVVANYQAYDENEATGITVCYPGSGTCNLTEEIGACYVVYYKTKDRMGNCSNGCGSDYITYLECPF
jgi:hypothetical protein